MAGKDALDLVAARGQRRTRPQPGAGVRGRGSRAEVQQRQVRGQFLFGQSRSVRSSRALCRFLQHPLLRLGEALVRKPVRAFARPTTAWTTSPASLASVPPRAVPTSRLPKTIKMRSQRAGRASCRGHRTEWTTTAAYRISALVSHGSSRVPCGTDGSGSIRGQRMTFSLQSRAHTTWPEVANCFGVVGPTHQKPPSLRCHLREL